MGKKRHCTQCGESGHNARTCLQHHAHSASTHEQKPQTKTPSSAVVVRTMSRVEPSPHLTNLRDTDREKTLRNAPVYKEQAVHTHSRNVVDLAQMVREARHKEHKATQRKRMRFAPVTPPPVAAPVELPSPKQKRTFKEWFFGTKTLPTQSAIPRFSPQGFQPDAIISTKSRIEVALVVALVLVLTVLPIPTIGYFQKLKDTSGHVAHTSTNAFLALQASTVAAFSSDMTQAEQELMSALELFGQANQILEEDYGVLLTIASLLPIVGDQVTSRQSLLTAGHELAQGNTYLVRGLRALEQSDESFTDKATLLQAHLQSAIPRYEAAATALEDVDPRALPTEYQKSFVEFRSIFAAFVDDTRDTSALASSLVSVFGQDSFRRYLIMFQNNHELRPTGGFMGSFAVVDVQKGKVLNIEVPGGGTYDVQGQLTEYVEPPTPLLMTNNRWELQDANWFPDFSVSAEKIQWFYEHATGRSVDGVIAINASVLEDLLAIVGELESEELGGSVAADSALAMIQSHVESDDAREEGTPKAVIGELMNAMLTETNELNELQMMKLMSSLHRSLEEKSIQVQLNNPAEQEDMRTFGWTGEVRQTEMDQDYLMVVNANINGQKSDAKILQHIYHESVVEDDGTIINTVTIRRKHTGVPDELHYGADNISYIRTYVPDGAELLSVRGTEFPEEEGFRVPEDWTVSDEDLIKHEQEIGIDPTSGTRVTREFGKTVFGNWSHTSPGEESIMSFTYKLPFRVAIPQGEASSEEWYEKILPEDKYTDQHTLLVQKQSGIDSNISATITYPDNWMPMWRASQAIAEHTTGVSYEGILTQDLVIAAIMEYVKEE